MSMWEFGSKVKVVDGDYNKGDFGVVIIVGRGPRLGQACVRFYDGDERWFGDDLLNGASDPEWWGFLRRMEEARAPVGSAWAVDA